MNKYTFSRVSLVEEFFKVEADSEAEALELVSDGAPGVEITRTEWIDWYDDEYTLFEVEDDVVQFMKSKKVDSVCA